MSVTPIRKKLIRRSSLHDQTVGRLRDMIIEGELQPAGKIPEAKLCEELGVSRTPLREALKVLASEGLVELRPNRGATVMPIDPQDTAAQFEVLVSLEYLIGTLICERATAVELAELDELHQTLCAAHAGNDRRTYFAINQTIHIKLMQAAHNPVLAKLYDNLISKIRRARYFANYDAARWRASLDEHEQINQALQHLNANTLPALLAEHGRLTGLAIIEALHHPQAQEA